MPREYTPEEELELLERLFEDGEYIDNGTSRVVYALSEDVVYKIAIDDQGRAQNNNEIDNFLNWGSKHLAEIYAYGRYVIEMERVECDYDSDEIEWFLDDFFDEDEAHMPDERYRESIEETVYTLSAINGETSDNYQIGQRYGTDQWVAYDYGYDTNYNRNQLVSSRLDDVVFEYGPEEVLCQAIETVKELLDIINKKEYNIIRDI